MNKQENDVLNILLDDPFINQRILAESSGHSLGIVNRSVRQLIHDGYLDEQMQPTEKAVLEVEQKAPENAIILAAGFGMRMVPINTVTPKGLLEVNGEPLIERLIRQLHEAGVTRIYIVVGFMKEQFEYLIDKYEVELIVNEEYAGKNNLYSLKLASSLISNTYIVPCDLWCDQNPFRRRELYSWYMVSDLVDNDSSVRVNRKMELVTVGEDDAGNAMTGIAYLLEEQAATVRMKLERMSTDRRYYQSFWEETLYEKDRMIVQARVVHSSDVVEINTFEQLRDLDSDSGNLRSEALQVISRVFHIRQEEIADITVLKKGMTNRSFLFTVNGRRYIMRIPGEGTDRLIDRKKEASVYHVLDGRKICDDIVYMDPENGYKITVFLEGARVCDPQNEKDLKRCMDRLREFHHMSLKTGHTFDLFGQIEFYESLWNGASSVYGDYLTTKEHVFSLKGYIDRHAAPEVLTHIDAVPDNFLFAGDEVRLIDWEYAGMQDPHVDLAMFCIYSLYDRRQSDHLIDLYFEGNCPGETRIKIYCYIAVCGLLWSNWCEYKRNIGVEFGEYSLRQYRYAKDYYKIVQKESEKIEGGKNV